MHVSEEDRLGELLCLVLRKKNSFATEGEKTKIGARDEKVISIRRRSCSSVIFKGKSYSSVIDLRIRLGSLLFSSPSMLRFSV